MAIDLAASVTSDVDVTLHWFEEADIAEAARIILPSIPESNPRPVSIEDLETILRAAWTGTTPNAALFGEEARV